MVILSFRYSTLLIFTVAASQNMPPSVQPPAVVGCETAILSHKLIIISANFTGRLGSTVLTVFTPVFGGAVPSNDRFRGASIS